MKHVTGDITKTTYKELKVAVMDKDKWRTVEVI